MKQITYSESFKLAAVRQVLEEGNSISQTAKQNGVTHVSLRKWIDKYKNNLRKEPDDDHYLRKKLIEVTKERDILKSALIILAKDAH